MPSLWLCAALRWMLLHGPQGQEYWVNMDQVTSLRAPVRADLDKSFAAGVHCIVVSVNGKFVAATESCDAIYKLIQSR